MKDKDRCYNIVTNNIASATPLGFLTNIGMDFSEEEFFSKHWEIAAYTDNEAFKKYEGWPLEGDPRLPKNNVVSGNILCDGAVDFEYFNFGETTENDVAEGYLFEASITKNISEINFDKSSVGIQ